MKYQDLSLYRTPKGFRGRNIFWVQAWRTVQATLWRHSPKFAFGFRRLLLKAFGAKVGRNAQFSPSSTVTYPWFLETGEYCWIGDESVVYNLAKIYIGNNVALAHRVYLCTGSHDIGSAAFEIEAKEVFLSDEVWLANDVFVMPGITIERGVVVAARSTVLENLKEGGVYGGSPAKFIRYRKLGEE